MRRLNAKDTHRDYIYGKSLHVVEMIEKTGKQCTENDSMYIRTFRMQTGWEPSINVLKAARR